MAGSIPNLTPQARNALIAISVFVLAAILALLIWIVFGALTGQLVGDQWPGRGLLLLMDNRAASLSAKGAVFLLGLGATFLAQAKMRDIFYYFVIGMSTLGLLLSLILIVLLRDPDIAKPIFNMSPLEAISDYDSYLTGLNVMFGGLAGWLTGTLTTQLGIRGNDADPVPSRRDDAAPPPTSVENRGGTGGLNP